MTIMVEVKDRVGTIFTINDDGVEFTNLLMEDNEPRPTSLDEVKSAVSQLAVEAINRAVSGEFVEFEDSTCCIW